MALRSFALLAKNELIPKHTFDQYRLVLAGGYDTRVTENVEYLKELDRLATSEFGLETFTIFPSSTTTESVPETAQVIFLCSFNDAQRTYLLATSDLLLYTPANEHFGITPVEAMYGSVPVIAANSGGPLETVKDKVTGLILKPEAEVWAEGMAGFIQSKYDAEAMGKAGREHVKSKFSLETFVDEFEDILEELASGGRPTRKYDNVEFIMRIIMAIVIFIVWVKYC